MKKKRGYYSISAASKMVGIHQQTIRTYEREGLIIPERTNGNTRAFSQKDIELLEQIIHYTSKLGINLAGVHIILKMEKKIEQLQTKINRMFEQSKKTLQNEKEIITEETKKIKNTLEVLKGERGNANRTKKKLP